MKSIQQKINEAKKTEFNLKPSEIRKAEKLASALNGKPCEMTGFFYQGIDEIGFARVTCEICAGDERMNDVFLEVCIWDRRKSSAFAA
jgi:hypothetical protein